MCDPISLIAAVATAGSSLIGLTKKAPKPPPLPAVDAPLAVDSNADVREEGDKPTDSKAVEYTGFVEQRKAGVPVGGLGNIGRSGLAL